MKENSIKRTIENTVSDLSSKPRKGARKIQRSPLPTLKSETGTVYVCGQGDCCQLGLGEEILEKKRPTPNSYLKNIVDIIAGGLHSLAINNEGKVLSWGCNDEGALGRDGEESKPELVAINDKLKVVQVAAGDSISAAILEDGTLYAWGTFRDPTGVLGFIDEPGKIQKTPVKVQLGNKPTKAIKIAAGNNHLLVLTDTGKVYVCGDNSVYQCGHEAKGTRQLPAKHRSLKLSPLDLSDIVSIAAGGYHSFAIDRRGRTYSWGLNNFNQCAITPSHFEKIEKPQISSELTESNVTQIAAGEHHTLAIGSNTLYGIGRCDSSQLGVPKSDKRITRSENGTKAAAERVIQVPIPTKVSAVACGSNQSFAIDNEGKAFSWGFGESCALGINTEEDQDKPAQITAVKEKFLAASSGGQHTIFLIKE